MRGGFDLRIPGGAGGRDALDVLGAFPITFEAVTPSLISGNLLALGTQRGQSGAGITAPLTTLTHQTTGGADGGGQSTAVATSTSASTQYFSTPAAVTAGVSYTFTIRARANVAKNYAAAIAWYSPGPTWISSSTGTTTASIVGAWVTFTVTATAPAGATLAECVLLPIGGGVAIGDTLESSVACVRTSATIPGSTGARVRYPDGSTATVSPAFTSCVAVVGRNLVITSADSTTHQMWTSFALPAAWTANAGRRVRASHTVGFTAPATTSAGLARFVHSGINYCDTTWSLGNSANVASVVCAGPVPIDGPQSFMWVPTGTAHPNGAALVISPILFEVEGA